MIINSKLKYLPIAAFAAVALALAGCGGGGGSSPVTSDDTTMAPDDTTMAGPMIAGATVPSGTTITLPAGVDIQDGTLRADMDETITVEDIGTFTCVSADGCSVDLTDGVITTTGDITVVSLDVTDPGILAQLAAVLPPPPVELNELETAQAAAAGAATAAMTAAGNAMTAATAAVDAGEKLATIQTDEKSRGLATKAGDQAALAHAAYMAAKAASDDAAEATDVTAAVRAQVNAENAQADAEAAAMMAATYGQNSMDAANAELMIDGTVKSVGGTSLDAEAGSSVVITDGQTVTTGLLAKDMQPSHTVELLPGVPFVAREAPAADDAYVQAVAARTFDIGKLVDSADDTARLMIVTHYAGSKTVSVFTYSEAATDADLVGTKVGFVSSDDSAEATTNDRALKSLGMYYLAGDDTDTSLAAANEVGNMTEGESVYSYVSEDGDDNMLGTDDDVVAYVTLHETSTVGATTTYTYRTVDITVNASDATEDGTAEEVQVTATIPEATEYEHIHFGAWAALGAAKKDGSQTIDGLGIGFVQNFSGEGLTGDDMPNNGTADYSGNWVGTVRAADGDGNGAISLTRGAASLMADFGMATIEVDLTDLATLEGTIDTNTFSGTKATVGANVNRLTADAKFTGKFSGGFYGAKAAEAGGVFAFTSEDQEAGEFSGAFGAVKA